MIQVILKLKQMICERRSSGSPELLRLLVKNTPMDDETALLSAHRAPTLPPLPSLVWVHILQHLWNRSLFPR